MLGGSGSRNTKFEIGTDTVGDMHMDETQNKTPGLSRSYPVFNSRICLATANLIYSLGKDC